MSRTRMGRFRACLAILPPSPSHSQIVGLPLIHTAPCQTLPLTHSKNDVLLITAHPAHPPAHHQKVGRAKSAANIAHPGWACFPSLSLFPLSLPLSTSFFSFILCTATKRWALYLNDCIRSHTAYSSRRECQQMLWDWLLQLCLWGLHSQIECETPWWRWCTKNSW